MNPKTIEELIDYLHGEEDGHKAKARALRAEACEHERAADTAQRAWCKAESLRGNTKGADNDHE